MELSSSIANPDVNSNRSRKKRRKIGESDQNQPQPTGVDVLRWRTQTEQQIYSSKLLEALRQVRRRNEAPSPAVAGRTVRETADKINKKHKRAKVVASGDIRPKKPGTKKRLPPLLKGRPAFSGALEMQVRAMSVLTGLLNGAGVGLPANPGRLGSEQS
nr:transcription factor bHLH149-like [Ipomoea batatas]